MKKLFRSNDLTERPIFMEYVGAVKNSFCPFVEPAQQRNVLFFSEYELEEFKVEDFQAVIFYVGLIHTEFLRKERKLQTTRILHDLFCENAIFYLPLGIDITGRELFDWPHWLLKILYTKFSVLFGKFWKGERDTSRDGRKIPIPPDHFLSIRSAIKPVDIRFFSLAPQLTNEYLQSCDDGTSIFNEIPLTIPPEVLEVELFNSEKVYHDYFLYLVQKMVNTSFYHELKAWGLEQLRKAK